jgi:streptogramin lyase
MNAVSTLENNGAAKGKTGEAEVVREYMPIDDRGIHGVTFDGKLVWFARNDEVICFDPNTSEVVRRYSIPGAGAGTAFDGEFIYQLAKEEIVVVRPSDGAVVRRLPSPGKGADSGMAWGDGYLWVGQYSQGKINKVDPKTGEIVKTLTSDRFVTGVSCVDGELWHAGVGNDRPTELRRLGPEGKVEEALTVPVSLISGMERTKDGDFWCGGEKGKLRLVRRKRKH